MNAAQDLPPLLSIVTFLPLAGALFILAIPREAEGNARWTALWTTLVTLIPAIAIWVLFDPTTADFQFVESQPWLGGAIQYKMGGDGISVMFVVLTAFLMPICILASWDAIKTRVKEYMIAFLILETLMIGVFCALDLLLFYIFFEGGLIPMYLIIGVWGGANRIYASFKFFLYTLLGSVLMLIAMMALYLYAARLTSRRCSRWLSLSRRSRSRSWVCPSLPASRRFCGWVSLPRLL